MHRVLSILEEPQFYGRVTIVQRPSSAKKRQYETGIGATSSSFLTLKCVTCVRGSGGSIAAVEGV